MERQRKKNQRIKRKSIDFERQEQTMAKTIFEEMSGTYTQVGDYLLPDLKLSEKEQRQFIGEWGQRHRRYLKKHQRATYEALRTSGKLNSYLVGIDRQAEEIFSQLVKQMAEAEGVTEKLKLANPMKRTGMINNIRNRAMEIVNGELVYANEPTVYICTSTEISELPKVFWKYYDLYRRKMISLGEYAAATGLSAHTIQHFLKDVVDVKRLKIIEMPK